MADAVPDPFDVGDQQRSGAIVMSCLLSRLGVCKRGARLVAGQSAGRPRGVKTQLAGGVSATPGSLPLGRIEAA